MTLILAIPAKDGVVFASDSQITLVTPGGLVKYTEQKIRQLNSHCLWSGAGNTGLIQRVEEGLKGLHKRDKPLINLGDTLTSVIIGAAYGYIQFMNPADPNRSNLLATEFVFAEWRNDSPRILHILANGTAEWIDRPFALGLGAPYAFALLQKYQGLKYDLGKASLLAYKILEESIATSAGGIGYPIDIWQIDSKGARKLAEEEISALSDAANRLRDKEISLFLGWET